MSKESDYFAEIEKCYKEMSNRLAVLDIKSEIGMERFTKAFSLEDFVCVYECTFHAWDPNWYEEGEYSSGILRFKLFRHLERLFREAGLLKDDQVLTPIAHYSENPEPRPNLVIQVRGGKFDDLDQYICIELGERRVFEMVDDPEYVRDACQGAVG